MEMKSPPPCPKSVTVRRNPPRRARPTPASAAPLSLPPSSKISSAIRYFPTEEILSMDIPIADNPIQEISESSSPQEPSDSEKLKVFLRVRPIVSQQKVGGAMKNGAQKNVWPQNPNKKNDASRTTKAAAKKKNVICLKVNDSHSVTLCPPQSMTDVRRIKSEIYEGFSHVFCADSSQGEVYEKMVNPLVKDFLKGKSGMLAAMGPTGSGKTHTIFGSGREPGMVSLALRQIFSEKESKGSKCSRTFCLSMFEIYSERGKGEKIMDLSPEGGDLCMQQYNIKGLQETTIHDVQQAELLIASGMLKRSTAMTNSNDQSSRSQCIINIRSNHDNIDDNAGSHFCAPLLTIVDLAGAEREKRTGNQGARLLESNFINNTSMVFGLCLRSLLEHQRNSKKPFHKHFQNSLLTKYLRDFLEGKKRMALILTVKSGEEDYHDTSYLLRQASPFMNIKFENVEDQPANAFGSKRRTQTVPKAEQAKRMKFSCNEVCMDGEVNGAILHQAHNEELTQDLVKEGETNGSIVKGPNIINKETNENKYVEANISDSVQRARENQILLNFSRALWNVLKEYKNKFEASENIIDAIKHSLTVEKQRSSALEAELNAMKSTCSCGKEMMKKVLLVEESESKAKSTSCLLEYERDDSIDVHKANAQVSCPNFFEAEHLDNVPSEYVVFDKEDLNALEDTYISTDVSEPAVSDSELVALGNEISFFVKQYQQQHKEESNTQVPPSDANEPEFFEKQDVFEDTVTGSVEVEGMSDCFSCVGLEKHKNEVTSSVKVPSISGDPEKFEEQRNEKVDVCSTNLRFDEEECKEVQERDTNGEITGCNTSDSAHGVVGDEIAEENRGQQEEKEDVPDQHSVSSEDTISSQGCNVATKLPETQPSIPSSPAKPKRRLRPASSVMLYNVKMLDDATEQQQHGKRGEKEDVGRRRTQGSISLLRLLQQNVRR